MVYLFDLGHEGNGGGGVFDLGHEGNGAGYLTSGREGGIDLTWDKMKNWVRVFAPWTKGETEQSICPPPRTGAG